MHTRMYVCNVCMCTRVYMYVYARVYAGLLGVPYAFSKTGLLPASLLILVIVMLNILSCNILLACKRIMINAQKSGRYIHASSHIHMHTHDAHAKLHDDDSDEQLDTFGAVASFTLGPTVGHLLVALHVGKEDEASLI